MKVHGRQVVFRQVPVWLRVGGSGCDRSRFCVCVGLFGPTKEIKPGTRQAAAQWDRHFTIDTHGKTDQILIIRP